jgi:DNA-3-methyladenine glycosylase
LVVAHKTEPERFVIVETEAYTEDDPACHAYGRKEGRAKMLYESPGLAYVYLIYGIHHCLNVVTEAKGTAGAVLFRALEPVDSARVSTHGPGRLTKALGITTQAHNGIDLTNPASPYYLAASGSRPDPDEITTTTRIGISKAVDFPWRFYLTNSPYVSVRAKG